MTIKNFPKLVAHKTIKLFSIGNLITRSYAIVLTIQKNKIKEKKMLQSNHYVSNNFEVLKQNKD